MPFEVKTGFATKKQLLIEGNVVQTGRTMKTIRLGLSLALLLVVASGGCKKKAESSLSSSNAVVSVSSTSPADGAASIALTTPLEITFSEKMSASSVTVSADTACTGSIQLSTDNFSTCVPLGDPSADSTGIIFTTTPKTNLTNSTTYKLKVTTGTTSEAGTALSSEYSSTQGFITVSSTTAVADTTAPASPSIIINGGASMTDSLAVSLVLSATDAVGVTKFYVSNSNSIPAASASGWVSVTAATNLFTTHSYPIAGRGKKTLYAWFQDEAGNVSASASASIDLARWPGTINNQTSLDDAYFSGVMSSKHKLNLAGYTEGINTYFYSGTADLFTLQYDLKGENASAHYPLDSTGLPLWSDQVGGTGSDIAYGIALDSEENVYVAGQYKVALGFSDIMLIKYPGSGGMRSFLLKYGTNNEDLAYAVAVDSAGNSYLTGYTWGNLNDNSFAGRCEFFLSKVDPTGTLQWNKQFGYAGGGFVGRGVAVDSAGNIIAVGYANQPFDGNSIAGTSNSIVIYKSDSSNNKIWSKQISSASIEEAYGVAVNGTTIYVVGFSTGTIGGAQAGAGDLFLGSYDTNGNQNWTTQLGTSGQDYGYGVTVDKNGNVYVTGTTTGAFTGTNAGGTDLFVAKYNSAGIKQWVNQIGTTFDDFGQSVTTDSLGNVFVIGYTQGVIALTTPLLGRDAGSLNPLVLKYNASGVLQ